MNDKGELAEFLTEVEAKEKGFNYNLNKEEFEKLQSVKEEERVREFNFMRFWDTQKKFRTPGDKKTMHMAWTFGWNTAIELINKE